MEQEVRSKSAAMCRYLEAKKHLTPEGQSLSCHITSLILLGSMNSPRPPSHWSMFQFGSNRMKIPAIEKLSVRRPLEQLQQHLNFTL